MSSSKGTGLLGVLSVIFAILSVVDSIVHLVKEANADRNEKSRLALAVLSIRTLLCLQYLTVLSLTIKYKVKQWLLIISSFTYAIGLTILMILSCVAINFNYASISLICHVIASLVALGVSFKLLFNKFVGKKSSINKVLEILSHNGLAFSTLFSVVLAVVIGIILRQYNWDPRSIVYVGFIGELFLRMLKCLVLPLIFSSLVFAMGDIDTRLFGKIGLRTVCYYISTTIISIILGIILVLTIQPGIRGNRTESVSAEPKEDVKLTTEDTILDLIRNLFPDNIIEACFTTFTTVLKPPNITDTEAYNDVYRWSIGSGKIQGMNILGIVVFAIVFGVIIGQMKEEGKPLADFFKAFNNAMMTMTVVVIKFTPLAVFFLVLPQILKVDKLEDLLGSVGYYTMTVLVGLAIHGLIILPLSYLVLTRRNPFTLISDLSAALVTAFGTGSSTATMPVTFQCLEERMKLDKRVVRFCIPVGATINMDGTALYEAVAAVFIAQYRDIHLDLVQVIIVAITATAASIGAAGIPQAGLVTMVIVLNAVGLPVEDSALIVVIDWLIDRFRTLINVLGDAFGAGIVCHMSQKDIEEFDCEDNSETNNHIIAAKTI